MAGIKKTMGLAKVSNLHSYLLYLLLFPFLLFLSCKKDKAPSIIDADPIVSPTTGSRKELTIDSIFLYARQVYLWQDALPAYEAFDPRSKYSMLLPEREAYQTELFDISQLKINPASGLPYEAAVSEGHPRYSYLEESAPTGTANSLAGSSAGNAVIYHSLIREGDQDIAYLVLDGFPHLASCKDELDQVFAQFASAGPANLIVDLRNNRGGYVETASYVADLIVPSTLSGQVMFTEEYNPQMQHQKATILQYQPYLDAAGNPTYYKGRLATMADVDYSIAGNTQRFEKKGMLETVKNICFIVSGQTSSAAELLISSLKPYFTVRLVGEKTFGKPVGFFSIHIATYQVYLPSFMIRNAQGWSDYFDGMQPDISVGLSSSPVWGDPYEPGLSTALTLVRQP